MWIAWAITLVRDVLFLPVHVTTMMDVLSAADHSVATSVGSGLSQKSMARRLEVSPTVRNELHYMYVTLGLTNQETLATNRREAGA